MQWYMANGIFGCSVWLEGVHEAALSNGCLSMWLELRDEHPTEAVFWHLELGCNEIKADQLVMLSSM